MSPDMQRTHGFTLIELVIVTIVIGIMAAVLAPLMLSSLRAYDNTLGDVVVLDKLRYATERLAREIREVNYDAATGYAFSSGAMATNNMAFTRTYYDASGNPSPDTVVTVGNTGSAVTLAYSTYSIAGAQVLTDELGGTGNLVFTYLDDNGAVLGMPAASAVHAVQIRLTLNHNGQPYTQQTQVELKNR